MSKYKIGDILKFSNGVFTVTDVIDYNDKEYLFVVENNVKLEDNESIGVMYLERVDDKQYMTVTDEDVIKELNMRIAAKGLMGKNPLMN